MNYWVFITKNRVQAWPVAVFLHQEEAVEFALSRGGGNNLQVRSLQRLSRAEREDVWGRYLYTLDPFNWVNLPGDPVGLHAGAEVGR